MSPTRLVAEMPAGLDADDTDTLRWKLHVLDLALAGLIRGPSMISTGDLQALQRLVDELTELAPWWGDGQPTETGREV